MVVTLPSPPTDDSIAACYSGSLDELNSYEGFLFKSNWKEATIGMSFDGASVMLGSQNSAATILKSEINGSSVRRRVARRSGVSEG
eukprot:4158055-Prymnesium_polylepis.2